MRISVRTGQTLPIISRYTSLFLVMAITLSVSVSAMAETSPGGLVQGATPTQILLFNMSALADYDISTNGANSGSGRADQLGILEINADLSAGDRVSITWTGVTPVDASVPMNFSATGDENGCVTIAWNMPPVAELISGYVLLWGTDPNVYGDSATFNLSSVDRSTSNWTHVHCGYAAGTYYFALRAHNQFDDWSGRTPPAQTTITAGNAQAPAPPQGVSVSEDVPGCALISWTAVSNPAVIGYRVHYGSSSVSSGQATSYPNVVTVTSATSVSICDLAEDVYYFAVTSFATGDLESGFSQEVTLDLLGADVEGPVISSVRPANGDNDVALNSNIFFVVVDDKSSIDIDGLLLEVNGLPTPVTYSESNGGFFVQTRALDLAGDSFIVCEVTVSDMSPNANTTVHSWVFRTGSEPVVDTDAPAALPIYPADGQTDVAADAEIVIRLRDVGVGVGLQSIVVTVDDIVVNASVTGTPEELTIRYRPEQPFTAGSTVRVGVEACDEATPANCITAFELTFTVAEDLYAGLPDGAIVPDGFWADDPTRPMQVRNLPQNWVVRIFDASGAPVRRFKNNLADDYAWTWDFRNDRGKQVGRALYLIRITDESGGVRRSGRFLVQIDP